MGQVIPLESVVDGQKIRGFNLNLLFWSFLAMFADGYDISVMPFAGKDFTRLWHVGQGDLTLVLTASSYGVLLGAALLGWVGDRYGRKPAILLASLIYGVTTLAVLGGYGLQQTAILRFLTGIGIGGLMPNTIALNSELAPKRWRATLVVLMFTGVTLGSTAPGQVAAWLMPHYGWRVLFVLGGAVPLIVAVCLVFALPESIKFLSLDPARRLAALRLARRMRPDLELHDDAVLTTPPMVPVPGSGLGRLLGPEFRWITLMLWVCFAMTLMAQYFLNTWMPLLYADAGLPPRDAALASSLYHVGGTVGGLLISVLLDRFGFAVIVSLFVIAVPAIAAIGLSVASYATLAPLSMLAGFTVLGAQFGNNAASGLMYPSVFRSKAVGWALSIGRLGAIVGPTVGGLLIKRHWSMHQLFLAASLPMAVGTVAALVLMRLLWRRLGELRISDQPAAGREAAAGVAPAPGG